MDKKKNWLAVILFGIVIAFSGTAMFVSGNVNLDRFYDVGDIEDALLYQHQISLEGTNNMVVYFVKETKNERDWLYLELSDLNRAELDVIIEFVNYGGARYTVEAALTEGENWISAGGNEYLYVYLTYPDEGEVSFHLDKMQFREQKIDVDRMQIAAVFGIIFSVYMIVIQLLCQIPWKKRKKVNWYSWVEMLQRIFLKIGGVGERIYNRIGGRTMKRLRILCLCSFFFYMQIMSNISLYTDRQYFKYHMYFCVTVLMLYAWLCWERPLKILNWNHRLAKAWFGLWLIAVISEFILPKRFLFQGLIMIFVMGFCYFMVGNMTDKMQLLRDLRWALKCWGWVNIPLCILFSPYGGGMRYLGMSKNANIWAMDLVFVLAAFLSSLLEALYHGRNWKYILLDIFSAAMIWEMLVKTGSSCGLIPGILCVFIFFAAQWKRFLSMEKKWKYWGMLIGGLMLFLISSYASDGLLRMNVLNWQIRTEETVSASADNLFSVTVQAAVLDSIRDNRVVQKFLQSSSLSAFTTGRNYFWIKYLRESNLWGHTLPPKLWGKSAAAHNGLLAMNYRYGVLVVVPYLLTLGYYVMEVWRYRKKTKKSMPVYAMLLMFTGSVLILLGMENVEYPFYHMSWYCLYLPMGIFFQRDV